MASSFRAYLFGWNAYALSLAREKSGGYITEVT